VDLAYPVESEEADVLTKAIPGERVPDWDVVVEALKLDAAFSDLASLVGVPDRRVPLSSEGVEQRPGD
jgi:hypothetical protein